MLASKKMVALAAAFAVLATPLAGAAAQTRTYHRHYAYWPHSRPYAARYLNYPAGLGYGYGAGWRLRSNARGWDNSCIDAPWLPSEFACSAK
jgi:hypothetical protein